MRLRRAVRTLACVACAGLFAGSVGGSGGAAARRFDVNDYQAIVALSSPQISPDGTHAIVIATRTDANKDDYLRELDDIDVRDRVLRPLTYERKGLADPTFSPQGDRIAFIADAGSGDDAKPQVFVLRLDGGDPRPVTSAPEGVDNYAWRPDGAAIAYCAADAKPKLAAPAKFHDSFVVGNNPITAHEAPPPLHAWLAPLDGGAARQLTKDPVRSIAGRLAWSPDGKLLAFALAPDATLNDEDAARITLLDVASGTTRALTGHTGYESDPSFSPDGSHIAYLHSPGDDQITLRQVYVTTPAGGEGTAVTAAYDRSVHGFAWLPDGAGVYFTAANGSTVDLATATLAGATSRIDLGEVIPTSPLGGALAKDGSFVFAGTTSRSPSELYRRPASGGSPVAVTGVNSAIASLALGATESVPFRSDTGAMSEAVVITPPDFSPSKTYPLVLLIHGGPTSASTFAFNRAGQLMAARGWLVLQPNYRGSDNHGFAYQSAVRYDPEDGPGRDIDAAVKAVLACNIVDRNRIAVSGWSYGGIMTAWMVTHYHYWKAAVSGASVNDWSTDYSVADDSDADAALFHSGPWAGPEARAEYDRASAVNYAKDVTSPVLILGDVGDNRDPIATSYEFYHALKDSGKDVTFIAWPVAGHFPGDPVRALDVYEHWIDFIAARLR